MTAIRYPIQLVGVSDGTLIPPRLAEGALVGGRARQFVYSKVTGTVWAATNRFYLGKKPAGHLLTSVRLVTDTSLGTSTISVGITGTPAKYVDAATLTVVNRLTEIGVIATQLDIAAIGEEDLFATIGTADIAAATRLTFILETTGLN
jgi:hypothetical protein